MHGSRVHTDSAQQASEGEDLHPGCHLLTVHIGKPLNCKLWGKIIIYASAKHIYGAIQNVSQLLYVALCLHQLCKIIMFHQV